MACPQTLVQTPGTWKTAAFARCGFLQLGYRRMLDWYDMVMDRVDQAWFEEQCRKDGLPTRTLADAHPLYRLLTEGTDTALVQVCELGQYFASFSSDPAITEIATDLISPKFASTRFELAMAYRWKLAGAQVVLQAPAGMGRRADFSAVLHGLMFTVEASNISSDLFDKLSFRAPLLIRRAVRSVLRDGMVLVVKLTVRNTPSKDWEPNLLRSVKECCSALDATNDTGDAARVARDTAEHMIEVERKPALGWPGIELGHREALRWDVQFDQVTETEPRQLQLRILVNFPAESPGSAPRILKKLRTESNQLRGVRGARVVLLDISGIEPNALQLNTESLRQGLRHELKGTPELACVWLISRGWTTEMRYQYRAQLVANAESPFQLPESFLGQFVHNEWQWDFLGEREIIHGTEEEAIRNFRARQPRF